MYILGISAFYHDSAACLLKDEAIVAAAQEERFSRIKNDAQFPLVAIQYCLKTAGIQLSEVDYVVFYEKPFLKFERLLESYLATAPRGLFSFLTSMPVWIKEKIFQKKNLVKALKNIDRNWTEAGGKLLFTEHHQAHAASAFFPSPFKEACILTIDGVGEWATTSVWQGTGNQIRLVKEITFPHSIGLLYSAFTYYLGFKVNSDEYKVMGLAPYGEPKYTNLIFEHLVDLKEDGSYRLNMDYFNYTAGLTMTGKKFDLLFGHSPRQIHEELNRFHMDLASSIQQAIEKMILVLVGDLVKTDLITNLCLAGGVALNGVVNGKILKESGLEGLWIQPAAGDAGAALGAAYSVYYEYLGQNRTFLPNQADRMQNALLGPAFDREEILQALQKYQIPYTCYDNEDFYRKVATHIDAGKVIGWFNGRMEFGPRALGARSIIADSRSVEIQSRINLKVKFRESFRPFAPAILAEQTKCYFNLKQLSPYMLIVDQIKSEHQLPVPAELIGFDRLKAPYSSLPATTHVDYSSRIQTVDQKDNPSFHRLIKAFYELTGCPAIVNTSFNIKDQPIVCTPEDAVLCFMKTDLDLLVFPGIIIQKNGQ